MTPASVSFLLALPILVSFGKSDAAALASSGPQTGRVTVKDLGMERSEIRARITPNGFLTELAEPVRVAGA